MSIVPAVFSAQQTAATIAGAIAAGRRPHDGATFLCRKRCGAGSGKDFFGYAGRAAGAAARAGRPGARSRGPDFGGLGDDLHACDRGGAGRKPARRDAPRRGRPGPGCRLHGDPEDADRAQGHRLKVNSASEGKKAKITAAAACTLFTKLQANGNEGLKWISANKDWCSIPDSFVEGFKADHGRVTTLRGKVCNAAQQQAAMEKKARAMAAQQQQGGGGGGLLGGPGLTGSFRVPQGAL
jgi:hypothetical protein